MADTLTGPVTTARLRKLDGLIAAPYTPFDRSGAVNLKVIEAQVAHLIRSGVIGAYVCGTTGEGVSCTVAERKAVVEEWVRLALLRPRVANKVED